MSKPSIAIGLSPNTQKDDVWQAIKTIFQPWTWKDGDAIKETEEWFKKYLDIKEVTLFNSGRSAMYAVLKSFDVGEGDEVLIQAFTCVAVPEVILWTGAKPVYADIDDSLNIDLESLEKRINKKTRAIIVQHTFGIPAKIELIKEIAQKHHIILIEDCAHSLGAESGGQKIGTFGDAAIFSFGRDKVISSVFGGMAIISSKYKVQSTKLKEFHRELPNPSYFWIFQQILHPIAFSLILPLYNIYLGKFLLVVLQKLNLLSKPIYKEEFNGGEPNVFPKRYPNALASLLMPQLEKLDKYNRKRMQIADYYYGALSKNKNIKLPPKIAGSIYLRFNILTDNARNIFHTARKYKILLGNWYRNVVDPIGVNYEKVGYQVGSCPKAEKIASLSVNLPTYPRLILSDLTKLIDLLTKI